MFDMAKHEIIELNQKGSRTYELTFSALFKSVKIPQVIQALYVTMRFS